MPDFIGRESRRNDEEALKRIWSLAFNDREDFIDMFFAGFYKPGMAELIERGGVPASAGYTFFGYEAAIPGVTPIPLSLGYAIGTLPKHLGAGLGTMLVNAMRDKALKGPSRAFCVSPSTRALRIWYANTICASDYFSDCQASVLRRDLPSYGSLKAVEIDAGEYNSLRNGLLAEKAHVRFPEEAALYLQSLCRFCGGALYRIDCGDGFGCAATERSEAAGLRITELIVPDKYLPASISLLTDIFSADNIFVRTPPIKNIPLIPSVMVSAQEEVMPEVEGVYWGPVFD